MLNILCIELPLRVQFFSGLTVVRVPSCYGVHLLLLVSNLLKTFLKLRVSDLTWNGRWGTYHHPTQVGQFTW